MEFLQRKDNNEILLKSSLASIIVYQDNPKEYLEKTEEFKSADHQINNICFSYCHGDKLEYFNKLNGTRYLIIDDKKNKKLYIAFRGTSNLQDVLVDTRIYPVFDEIGILHNGFYRKAENIPTLYLIKKLVEEEYDLIFTGHSLGAAIAAMTTINIMYRLDITEEYSKKILFIGYGSPSIANIYFKNDIDQRYKNNFVFIKNQKDIVVEILEYLSYLIHTKENNNNNGFDFLLNFISNILQYVIGKVLDIVNIESFCKQMKAVAVPISKLIIPQYTHFGTLLELNIGNGLKKVEMFKFNENDFKEMFKDPGLLVNKIQNHFINNYYRNLIKNHFQGRINMINRKRELKIDFNKDLEINLDNINFKPLKILKSRNHSEITFSINTTKNFEYIVAIILVLDENRIFCNKIEFQSGLIDFKFNCPNNFLYVDEKYNPLVKDFKFEIYSHFNQIPLIKTIIPQQELPLGLNPKQKEIQDMPFDLLYLHAAYFIRAISRMEKNNLNNKINQKFIDAKNDLLEKFQKLDEILKAIRNEEIYKQDLKDKIKAISYFDYRKVYEKIVNEKEFKRFQEHILEEIDEPQETINMPKLLYPYNSYEEICHNYQEIKKYSGYFLNDYQKVIDENYKSNYEFKRFQEHILKEIDKPEETINMLKFFYPYLYEESFNKNQKSEIKNLANSYLDYLKVNDEDDKSNYDQIFQKIFYEKEFKGFQEHILEEIDEPEGTINMLKFFVPYLYEIKNRTCRISKLSDKLCDKIFEFTNFEKVIPKVAAGAAFGVGAAAAVAALNTAAAAADAAADTAARLKNYFINSKINYSWNFDDIYKLIIKKLNDEDKTIISNNRTCWNYECLINEEFIDEWKEKKDKIIFKIILINSQIREILCRNYIFGSIGNKNAGKSKFVNLITNQNTGYGPNTEKTTSITTAYSVMKDNESIYDDIVFFDYPHFNSNQLCLKLEFYFTRLFLDHVFIVFNIENLGQTESEKKLYDLVTRNCFFDITLLYNKCDTYINKQTTLQNIKDDKKSLVTNFGSISEKKLFFTCMEEEDEISTYRYKFMKDNNNIILLKEPLKDEIISIIKNQFKNCFDS